ADRLPGGDGFVELLGRLFVPLGLVSFGLFVVWLYTARRNLDGFAEVRTKWGWGWTFAAWLVPVVNLFAPAAVIADTARESRRSDTGGGTRIGALVWVGWLAFLTVVGMGCYADATRPSRETVTITVSLGSTSDDVM